MQPIVRKTKKHRSLLPLLLLLSLCAAVLIYYVLKPEETVDLDSLPDPYTYGELVVHEEDDVSAIAVQTKNGETWTIRRSSEGDFVPEGETWSITSSVQQALLRVSASITYDDIVTEDPTEYTDRLEEFGLDQPVTATITYSDNSVYTLHFGQSLELEEENLRYMTVDGDDRLFVIASGTADAFDITLASMHPVLQPGIEKARIDRITLQGQESTAQWQLQGEVTDASATDAWQLTLPDRYPADGTSVTNLRQSLSQLRMGAYVCDADEEALATYGLTNPELSIIVHMAEALVNETDDDGAVTQVLRAEETVRMDLGAMKSEYVRYVAFDGVIYTCSEFTLSALTNVDPYSTVSRYVVTLPLSSLTQMTYTTGDTATVWQITPATDETDGECTRDGETYDYNVFEAAYARLENVTVSGRLPDGWQSAQAPHTVLTLRTDAGLERTVALVDFDAMHDAVLIDGCALFYLIKGGLSWELE